MATPVKIGKYEVRSRLGEGGMAIVFEAYDPVIQRTVAIKAISKALLAPAERPFILDRFKREAQAAGRLVHPNIVAIHEYGEDADFAFIVMECVQGGSLADLLATTPRPNLERVRELVAQLLDALQYSHSQGVVHRDIKPSNILINKDGRIKVSDFGIARIESSHLTHAGDVMGTPNYMSPEQFLGQDADHRSDLYSAAVIVYELLAGRRPFMGTTASIMQQVLQVAPPNPSDANPDLPAGMDQVLQRALAKQPEERYQSAQDFARALLAVLEGRPRREGAPAAPRAPAGLASLARRIATAPPPAQEAAPAAEPERAEAGPRPRVLFVDDEERILNALRALFKSRYHVFTATDGAQALDFARKFPMHAVVSDQRMPGMVGVELLRRLKEVSPHSVRILLTGYSDLAAIVGSINDGEVYRFISKPWDNQDIKDTVAEAVAIGVALTSARAPAAAAGRSDATTLILDRAPDLYRAARALLGDTCRVAHAAGVEAALEVLRAQEVAVIVADLEKGGAEVSSFLKLLKQKHPAILSIVVTAASDSETVIELINEAQIFRFLNQPVNLALMKSHVAAALVKYQSFRGAPVLLRQHKVKDSAKARQSSLARVILDALKALAGRSSAAR